MNNSNDTIAKLVKGIMERRRALEPSTCQFAFYKEFAGHRFILITDRFIDIADHVKWVKDIVTDFADIFKGK